MESATTQENAVENYGARAAARALRPLRTTATPWRTTSRPRSSDDAARGSRAQRDAERTGSRTAPPTPGRWLFRQRTRLLGLVTEWSTLFIDAKWKIAVGFVALIVALIVRPQGIFGKAKAI